MTGVAAKSIAVLMCRGCRSNCSARAAPAARGCPSGGGHGLPDIGYHREHGGPVGPSRYTAPGWCEAPGLASNLSAGYPPSVSEPVAQRPLAGPVGLPDQHERACPAITSISHAEGPENHQLFSQVTALAAVLGRRRITPTSRFIAESRPQPPPTDRRDAPWPAGGCVDIRHRRDGEVNRRGYSAPVCPPPTPPKLQCEFGRPGRGSSRREIANPDKRGTPRNLQLDETRGVLFG